MTSSSPPPPPVMPRLPSSLADQARALLSSPDRLAALVGGSPEAMRGARVILARVVHGSLVPRAPEHEEQPSRGEPPFPVGDRAAVAGE